MPGAKKSLVYKISDSFEGKKWMSSYSNLINKLLPAKSEESLLNEMKNIFEKMVIDWEDVDVECLGYHLISAEPRSDGLYFLIHYNEERHVVEHGDIGYQWCKDLTQCDEQWAQENI